MPKNIIVCPATMRIFTALRHDSSNDYWTVLSSFRQTFARAIPGQEDSHFPVHFIGLWDTVSSVGWAWDPPAYPFTAKWPNVAIVRHARGTMAPGARRGADGRISARADSNDPLRAAKHQR